ncbi:probable ADP-ribosylation factor GTPase-activating protein AGD14 [Neltuma alba]|uniref:probable ADP-ribosylation factor GTPase-activating protein AGD14 n=1 Tax=Neltuma alba TaxID=207710 RepID=UPI0010A46DD8|nr:probable ADP-ribosylation factor GTPase-activating protein AGD14 [Prosopis alba]
MASRKEDERNEKIIRGLMKLPPNRRCINCNSLGPQYVCTTFWTFVCMTCSGIHREFTHRVKSVSMAKFTSQEVEALQNGGNQRARDIYLKDWDFQRQRMPDSSNVDKIREFIRNVYIDRRYAGARSSDKPPRDTQSPRIHGDDTRRASSYHSYSQSPPYDYQYEDRRYGRQAAALTRKPGSDKGRYEGKISSIMYSPGRFSDHASEDGFANDGSGPRNSDYSVSNAGEQFKSAVQSPKFYRDMRSSPFHQRSSAGSSEDIWSPSRYTSLETIVKGNSDGHHPQRITPQGSTDCSSSSQRSYSSGGLDFFSEPVQASGSNQDKVSAIPVSQQSRPARSVSLDLSKVAVASEPLSSLTPPIDLFEFPASSQAPSVDLFQPSILSSALSLNQNQPSQASQFSSIDFFVDVSKQQSAAPSLNQSQPSQASQSSPIDFFADVPEPQPAGPSSAPSLNQNQPSQASQSSSIDFFADVSKQQPAAPSDEKSPEFFVPKNEGWATFDVPQHAAASPAQVEIPAGVPSTDKSLLELFDPFSTANASKQWPSFDTSGVHEPSITSNAWHGGVQNGEQASVTAANAQPWNAFEDSGSHLPVDTASQGLQLHNLPSSGDQFLSSKVSEGPKGGLQDFAPIGAFNDNVQSDVGGLPYPPTALPLMEETQRSATNQKSTNPFDLPHESDVEHNSMFLDLSSLQAALPDSPLAPPYNGGNGIAEPWLPQSVTPYISSAGQGGLTFMAAQPPSSQIPNIPTQGPVASFGGNPFA